jgi:hypothetical protein
MEILGHEEGALALDLGPQLLILGSAEPFVTDSVRLVTQGSQNGHQPQREILVELDPHHEPTAARGCRREPMRRQRRLPRASAPE